MRVAVIDDVSFNRRSFEEAVEEIKNIELKEYAWREDFLKDYIGKGEKFDIIFLDGTMPGMTVEEFFEKVKAYNEKQKIIMFGGVPFEYIQHFIDLKADGFIRKPLDKEQLEEKIEKIRKAL